MKEEKMESPRSDSMRDRLAVADTLVAYAWAYDQRDLEALGECFAEDATCSGYLQDELDWGPVRGRTNVVDGLAARMAAETFRPRHFLSDIRFAELTDETAQVYSYFLVPGAQDGKMVLITAGWYLDRLVKRDGTWKLSHKEWHLDSAL
jgi:3-phenylpropionate/cinnamic acid dioxygenase small subunit